MNKYLLTRSDDCFRQGDVLLMSTDRIEGRKLTHLILAEGEVTGHKHQITSGEAELREQDGKLILIVSSETATLSHEEHKPIQIPQGTWIVRTQREYSPLEEWRQRYVTD